MALPVTPRCLISIVCVAFLMLLFYVPAASYFLGLVLQLGFFSLQSRLDASSYCLLAGNFSFCCYIMLLLLVLLIVFPLVIRFFLRIDIGCPLFLCFLVYRVLNYVQLWLELRSDKHTVFTSTIFYTLNLKYFSLLVVFLQSLTIDRFMTD